MPELNRLTSRLAPLPIDNVDTDQIIPASYLKVTDKSGVTLRDGPSALLRMRLFICFRSRASC